MTKQQTDFVRHAHDDSDDLPGRLQVDLADYAELIGWAMWLAAFGFVLRLGWFGQ